MRHYEVVFLVHPDQSDNVSAMVERYTSMIETGNGKIHRQEDWGRRMLAYPINKLVKAHYYMMNIECDQEVLAQLEDSFRFNDAVLRHLVIRRDEALTEPTAIFNATESKDGKDERKSRRDHDTSDNNSSDSSESDDNNADQAA